MNTDLTFVEAAEEYVEDMLDLYNFYIKNTTATFDLEEISLEDFLKRIRINEERYKTYIVKNKDIMIGFCFYNPYRTNPAYDKTVEIGLYIKPKFTGKKYGETIVNYLEKVIEQNNFRNIIASISSDNIYSIRLFSRLGYCKCADYKEIAYKKDHYVGIIDFQKIINEFQ